MFSAAVTAAPVLTTDSTATQSWPETATTLDAKDFADQTPQLLTAIPDVSTNSTNPDAKSFASRFQISNFGRQNWNSTWDTLSGKFDSYSSSWLPRVLRQVKDYDYCPPGTPPVAAVPAPSAILLGTIGLLLVRVLRERRIIE